MKCSIRLKAALAGALACLLLSSGQLLAQAVNGLVIEPRVDNDFPNSTETITVNGGTPMTNPSGPIAVNGIPDSVTINNTNMVNSPPGGFANLDEIVASTNGGASPYTGNINTGFTISADVTLNDGSNSPRKEAGLRVISSVSGDAQFIVDSDAGEIVAFGGGAPFYSFQPALEAAYVPGQTIFLQEQYIPGVPTTTMFSPGTMQYWAQLLPGGPLLTSGRIAYSNLEGGPTNYQIGVYDQAPDGSTTPSDFINAQFNNITAVVPEPGSLSMLVLGAMTLLSRRRTAKFV